MNASELRTDKVYYFDFCSNGKSKYVGRVRNNGNTGLLSFINDNSKKYYDKNKSNDHGLVTDSSLRLATPMEVRWLEACEKANKFIPFEDIKPIIRLINY